MKNNSVCAIVVTLNPSPVLRRNLEFILEQCSEAVIVDNGSESDSMPLLDSLSQLPNVHIVYNRTNKGVAHALNIGVDFAAEKKYEWVATFDQDSALTKNMIGSMLQSYQECPFQEKVALICPVYLSETGHHVLFSKCGDRNRSYAEIKTAMTSGNLIKCRVFSEVGKFLEPYFIDYVDHEFCLRLRKNKSKIIQSCRSTLYHNLGRTTFHRIGMITVPTTNHAPFRRYYMARNRVFVYKKYLFFDFQWVMRDLLSFGSEIGKVLLFEKDKGKKLFATTKGLIEGLISKGP